MSANQVRDAKWLRDFEKGVERANKHAVIFSQSVERLKLHMQEVAEESIEDSVWHEYDDLPEPGQVITLEWKMWHEDGYGEITCRRNVIWQHGQIIMNPGARWKDYSPPS